MALEGPEPQRLIRWIEDYWEGTVHNLSSSGLPEPILSEMGIDTSFENMKKETGDTKEFFKNELCRLYGFEPENVFITTGGSESIGLLSLLARAWKLPVYVGLPEYEPIFNVPSNLGVETHTAPFSELDGMMSRAPGPKAFFFSNPNNPLGNRHSKEFLQSLREKHFANGGFMYADEAFLEFMDTDKLETFYDGSDEIVINGSMTKFYGFSGFRVGWIVASRKIIDTLRDVRNITGTRNPDYPLWIAGQFLRNRSKFRERARRIINPNLEYLRNYILQHENLEWSDPRDASYALVKYRHHMTSEEFCRGAYEKEKILLGPGEYFGAEGAFRLCFTEEPEKFRESIEALDRYLSSLA